ncbi:MAG: hypothetical protein QOD57_1418 [Actinomycetota bacterium]|nr:hypothetical protein [Actinomycetota bacterium]
MPDRVVARDVPNPGDPDAGVAGVIQSAWGPRPDGISAQFEE